MGSGLSAAEHQLEIEALVAPAVRILPVFYVLSTCGIPRDNG
ncbi:MAG: hypothetical protein AAF449_07130 [Myxococcota bacterium]